MSPPNAQTMPVAARSGVDATTGAMSGPSGIAAQPPTIPCGKGTTGIFYGVGGHVQQGGAYAASSYALQVSQLRDLGMTMYAQDISDQAGAEAVARLARVGKPQCVGVLAALTPDFQKTKDEAAAYQNGYKLGRVAAITLKGLVQYYQVGNEFDNNAIHGGHGNEPSDYDNAIFMKARGSILGMIDGIKAADPSAQIILSASSWLHFGFSDMLHAGTQPDGSGGHPIPKWDITAWHWYSDMGDITFARGINVLKHLQDTYHKPIWITEFGARPGSAEQQSAAYLVGENALAGYVENAKKYDIQSVAMYELYDDQIYGGDGNYGVIMHDGATHKGRYDVVKSFIATHPMP
jgi:hypothetical protein